MPKASIIIPTYNRDKFIAETIQSVLGQTFKDLEVIVVDDGSIDNTKEIVEKFIKKDGRVRYIYQKNSGRPSIPRNFGFKNSTGDYLAFLDSDDVWLPEKLEKQILFFEKSENKKLGFLDCRNLIIDENGLEIKNPYVFPNYHGNVFRELLKYNFIFTPGSVLIKRNVIDEIGCFDENLISMDDWDIWIRISKKYYFDFIDELLFKYRVHISNITATLTQKNKEQQIIYIFEKHIKDFNDYCPDFYYRKIRELANFYCKENKIKIGRNYFIKAIKLKPRDFRNYPYYLLSLFGSNFYNFILRILKIIFQIKRLFPRKKSKIDTNLRGGLYKNVLNIEI